MNRIERGRQIDHWWCEHAEVTRGFVVLKTLRWTCRPLNRELIPRSHVKWNYFEIKFSLCRRPTEIIIFQRVEACLKLLVQNCRSSRIFSNTFNAAETISSAEMFLSSVSDVTTRQIKHKKFLKLLHCLILYVTTMPNKALKLFQNYFKIFFHI